MKITVICFVLSVCFAEEVKHIALKDNIMYPHSGIQTADAQDTTTPTTPTDAQELYECAVKICGSKIVFKLLCDALCMHATCPIYGPYRPCDMHDTNQLVTSLN